MCSSSLIFDSSLTDEAYFILRAKEALKSDIYESKSWMLTAKTLYPQNFNVLHEAYQIDKISQNVKEAAESFSVLFQLFSSKDLFWPEIKSLVNAVLSNSPVHEEMFLKSMFSEISPDIQHDLLTVASEKSVDPMEHCRILLLILQRFPVTLPKLGPSLVESLMTAEKHSNLNPLNCYREMLVGELIPVLLSDKELELSDKLLIRMLYKIIGFYVEFFSSQIFVQDSSDVTVEEEENKMMLNKERREDSKKKYKFSWKHMFNLFRLFGVKLNWELCAIFNFPCDKENIWRQLVTYNAKMKIVDSSPCIKQLIICITVFFIYCLYQYTASVYPSSQNKNSLILVEAFTRNYGKASATFKKTSDRPILSTSCDSSDVIAHFMFTVRCWEMIHSSGPLQKELIRLKTEISLNQWLSHYVPDIALYHGKVEDSVLEHTIQINTITNAIKRLSYFYYLKNHNAVIENAVHVIKCLDTISEMGTLSDELLKDGNRHVYFLPVQKLPVLQYTVKVLMDFLLKSIKYPFLDKNRLHCELLVLVQLNLANECKLFNKILAHIKMLGSISFPLFSKFIVSADILENFMHMLQESNPPVHMDIILQPFKRNDEIEMKHTTKKFLKAQLKRCHDPVHTLIIEFILSEEPFFPRV